MPHLAHISLLVRDYDEAIAWYRRLGFELVEDTYIAAQQKRWVVIRPPPSPPTPPSPSSPSSKVSPNQTQTSTSQTQTQPQTTILLAQPSPGPHQALQENFIGNQAGGRVFLFLATDDFERDYKHFTDCGVEWVRAPKVESYGKVAVWRDLYGNLWDLVEYC